MTRYLFIAFTALFCLALFGFWLAGWHAPIPPVPVPPTPPAAPPTAQATIAPPVYTLAEVAAHHQAQDCWMAIDGKVYDLSAYLPQHPSSPDIIFPWCGKEASQAYATKTKGRSHSTHADKLLEKYLIGTL